MTSNQSDAQYLTKPAQKTELLARFNGYLSCRPGAMFAIVVTAAFVAGLVLLANSQGAIVLYQAF